MSKPQLAAPEPTEIARRYRIVAKLGAGAFGVVYKADDKLLGRTVAIKTIRLEGLVAATTGHEEMLERFYREARVAAQLNHPNIVTIHDVGDFEGLSYIAMEFIEGVGLDKVIAEGPIPLGRTAAIAAQVADALDFAHLRGVVHRDIKPANVMILPGDRVKVADFGIAKASTGGEQLTVTGSLLGTPSYMSPEQARGTQIDGRSDLFALGCVLYEMLCGHKAFQGDTITGLILKIVMEEPPPIRETVADLPDEPLRIIKKALAKSRDERYQTGRELADDLFALARPGLVRDSIAHRARLPSTDPAGHVSTVALGPGAAAQATIASAAPPPPPPSVAATVASPAALPTTGTIVKQKRPLAPSSGDAPRGGVPTMAVGAAVAVAVLAAGAFWLSSRREAPPPSPGTKAIASDLRADFEAGRYQECESKLTRVDRAATDDFAAAEKVARSCQAMAAGRRALETANPAAAAGAFAEVLAAFPGHEPAKKGAAEAEAALIRKARSREAEPQQPRPTRPGQAPRVDDVLAKAEAELKDGRLARARELAEQARRATPSDLRAGDLLHRIEAREKLDALRQAFEAGRFTECQDQAAAAQRALPRDAGIEQFQRGCGLMAKGQALLEKRDYVEAKKAFSEAAAAFPDSAAVKSHLARAEEGAAQAAVPRPTAPTALPGPAVAPTPARYLDGPKLRIPSELESYRDAVITVRVRVSPTGTVDKVDVLATPDDRFVPVVTETLKASHFAPATAEGKPVEGWVTMKLKAR